MGTDDRGAAVTLHSTWRGIVLSFAGAGLLFAAGLFTVLSRGASAFPVMLLIAGVLVLLGVAGDYPIASTFTADGVRRHTLIRRQFIDWGRVEQLTRARPGLISGMRKVVLGGLVAVVGRRRYLLVDQVESAAEYDRVVAAVGEQGEALEVDLAGRPADDVAPTWIYRRKSWAPDGAARR